MHEKKTILEVASAKYIQDYQIMFSFSDGMERMIDFREFLQNARNPMTTKYLDKNLFRNYTIEYFDIIWNDFEMCFPIWDLHEGKI